VEVAVVGSFNSINHFMKTEKCLLFITLIIFAGCNQPGTKGDTTDSTQLTTESVPLETLRPAETIVKSEPTPVISDSAANALNAFVASQFKNVLADSSKYYKVEMEDYYDEYEGQDEMKKYTWYFDKEFSIAYCKYSYQNGAMFKPDVIEFIARNDSVICTRETSFVYDEDVITTLWDVQNGGVTINQSRYSDEKIESIATDYGKTKQNSWEVHLDALKGALENDEEPRTGDEDVYYIMNRRPKHAELVDYTEVIIPKAVYDRLEQ